jgi:hypothetical protein
VIRAIFIGGCWRVVDDLDRRYLPNIVDEDGALGGMFVSRSGATDHGWDVGTQLEEQTALMLAGVLRRVSDAQQERARRILLTCDSCLARIRNES